MSGQDSSKKSISISVGEDNGSFFIEDIPALAWEQFYEKAKLHFPNSQDPWASAITEFIIAMGGGDGDRRSFIMTDVPEDLASKMDAKLSQVDWTWDRFHAYLLRSVGQDNLRIVSLLDKNQNFGTVVVTGIKPEVFAKLEAAHPLLTVEKYFGTLMMMMAHGEIKIDPETKFAEPKR